VYSAYFESSIASNDPIFQEYSGLKWSGVEESSAATQNVSLSPGIYNQRVETEIG